MKSQKTQQHFRGFLSSPVSSLMHLPGRQHALQKPSSDPKKSKPKSALHLVDIPLCCKIIKIEEIMFPPGLSTHCFCCLGQKSVTRRLLSTLLIFGADGAISSPRAKVRKRNHVPPFMCCHPFSRVLTDPLVCAGPPPFDTLDLSKHTDQVNFWRQETQSSPIEL